MNSAKVCKVPASRAQRASTVQQHKMSALTTRVHVQTEMQQRVKRVTQTDLSIAQAVIFPFT